ncbi:MAG: hypothetical protein ACP5DC_08995 [Halothiobacillaceae bacterium]
MSYAALLSELKKNQNVAHPPTAKTDETPKKEVLSVLTVPPRHTIEKKSAPYDLKKACRGLLTQPAELAEFLDSDPAGRPPDLDQQAVDIFAKYLHQQKTDRPTWNPADAPPWWQQGSPADDGMARCRDCRWLRGDRCRNPRAGIGMVVADLWRRCRHFQGGLTL